MREWDLEELDRIVKDDELFLIRRDGRGYEAFTFETQWITSDSLSGIVQKIISGISEDDDTEPQVSNEFVSWLEKKVDKYRTGGDVNARMD